MSEYKVKFEVFEGPLDLLLYLIKKEEVDIYEVNLTRLATQFIEYIEMMRLLDLEIAGEFLVMAATLMYIKSRELLPVDQQVAVEGEEEGEDPRWELIRQLVEYKKFKDAAAQLAGARSAAGRCFPARSRQTRVRDRCARAAPEVSIFDLLNAVNGVLQAFHQREEHARHFRGQMDGQRKDRIHHRVLASHRPRAILGVVRGRDEPVGSGLHVSRVAGIDSIETTRLRASGFEFSEIEICRATTLNGAVPPPSAETVASMPDAPPTDEGAHQS